VKKALTTVLIVLILIMTGICISVSAEKLSKINIEVTEEGLGSLEGTVNEWGGDPLEDAYVYIAGGHISLQDFDVSVVLDQNQTNVDGHYFIDDIPEGKYTVLVLRNGFGKQDKWVPAIRHTTVSSENTTTENFNLRKLGRTRSNVVFQSLPQIYTALLKRMLSILNN